MAQVKAIQNRSTVTLAELKEHLRLLPSDTSEDVVLTRYLKGAKAAADSYCGNQFLKDDSTDDDIPEDVENWILQKASELFHIRSTRVSTATNDGAGTVTLSPDDKKTLHPHWKGWI